MKDRDDVVNALDSLVDWYEGQLSDKQGEIEELNKQISSLEDENSELKGELLDKDDEIREALKNNYNYETY